MLPTSLLTALAGTLLGIWLLLSLTVLAGRAASDSRRRRHARDAVTLSSGRASASTRPTRRLRPIAEGDFWSASGLAARELVRRDGPRITAAARRRHGLHRLGYLRVLARGGAPSAVAELRRAAAGRNPDLLAGIVTIAAELDTPDADRLLLDLLVHGDHPRSRVATELTPRAHRLAPDLLELARHDDPNVRYWALMLLRHATADTRLGGAAVEGSADPDPRVRGAAARLLARVGQREQLHVLRALLTDDVFYVRAHAARAVGELGLQRLARDVASLLADESWWTRAAAKESLVALGDAGYEAALEATAHEDRFARDGAAEVLEVFRRNAAAPPREEQPVQRRRLRR